MHGQGMAIGAGVALVATYLWNVRWLSRHGWRRTRGDGGAVVRLRPRRPRLASRSGRRRVTLAPRAAVRPAQPR